MHLRLFEPLKATGGFEDLDAICFHEIIVIFNSRSQHLKRLLLRRSPFYDSKRSTGFLKVFFTGSTIRSDAVLT